MAHRLEHITKNDLIRTPYGFSGHYNYYIDITEELSTVFGAGIVNKAYLNVLCSKKDFGDVFDVIQEKLQEVVNEWEKGVFRIDAMDVVIEFSSGKTIRIENSEWAAICVEQRTIKACDKKEGSCI